MKRKGGRVGPSFEDYLKEEGTLEEASAVALKRVLAWQLEQAREREQISSRHGHGSEDEPGPAGPDPGPVENDHIRSDTLTTAALALGLSPRIELVR